MNKETLINCMVLVWWTAGMVWLFNCANGRQLADIRPTWARYACVVLTAPAYFALIFVVRFFEFVSHVAKGLPQDWQTFTNAVQGIRYEEKKDSKENG